MKTRRTVLERTVRYYTISVVLAICPIVCVVLIDRFFKKALTLEDLLGKGELLAISLPLTMLGLMSFHFNPPEIGDAPTSWSSRRQTLVREFPGYLASVTVALLVTQAMVFTLWQGAFATNYSLSPDQTSTLMFMSLVLAGASLLAGGICVSLAGRSPEPEPT